MIRCYPVDGSEPFEVENKTNVYWSGEFIGFAQEIAADPPDDAVNIHRCLCRVESWRERAERLEKELAVAKAETVWVEADHRADLASDGIGAMDYDTATKAVKDAAAEVVRLRALL